MTRANTEQTKHTPWFAKAGAACSIVPISHFVGPNIFALKGGGQAGDLTKFLLQLIICCLLENYWVNPFPGASFGINHFFSYIAQAMVAAFDQSSLDSLLQLLKTAGDNTAMPGITAPIQILCYFFVQALLGLGELSLHHCPRDDCQEVSVQLLLPIADSCVATHEPGQPESPCFAGCWGTG